MKGSLASNIHTPNPRGMRAFCDEGIKNRNISLHFRLLHKGRKDIATTFQGTDSISLWHQVESRSTVAVYL